MKILVADAHPLFRRGIQSVLSDSLRTTAVGHAKTDRELFQSLRKNQWDVLLIDPNILGREGLDILRRLKSEKPKLPVVVLSAFYPQGGVVRALRAGAFACLTKETEPDELVKAIKKAVSGQRHFGESLNDLIANELLMENRDLPHKSLSDREYQVMIMIASGKTITWIARTLSISPKTVSTHRRRLLQKLGLSNNAEVVRYAIDHKLIR